MAIYYRGVSDLETGETIGAEDGPGPALAPGDRLAERYRILRELGRGGMGVVFVAFDEKVGEEIALKVLPTVGRTETSLARFRQEVRLARHVTHRNVARTFDIGEHGELHYLTMELVAGESLAEILAREGRLTAERAADLVRQICDGLAAAHDAGVVHRDLKPANILVEGSGRAVITDFGIARPVGPADEITKEGAFLGTPAYMAPEQVLGQPPTPQTDIYAVGLVLYRALTGQVAFEQGSALASAVMRLEADPDDPRRHANVPAALAELVLLCLARDPQRRPPDARSVSRALTHFAEGSATDRTLGLDRSPSGAALRPYAAVDPGEQSVAVLPFVYRGPADDAYFADGLTDELIDLLSMTRGLKVCSRGATQRFKDDRDPKAVGTALSVGAVVDGTIQRSGERLRVKVRLVDAHSGIQSWSDRFETGLDDLLALEDEIAQRVAETLRLQLEERAHVGSAPARAVELYLQARTRLKETTIGPGGPEATVEMAQEAVDLAPDFKPARPCLASALINAWALPRAGGVSYGDRARKAVKDAVERASDVPMTQVVAARLAVNEGRYLDAAAALAKALKMAPTFGTAHDYLGMLQLEGGRPAEGRRRVELAMSLDPTLQLGAVALARHFVMRGQDAKFEAVRAKTIGAGRFTLSLVALRAAGWRRDVDEVKRIGEQLIAAFGPMARAPRLLVASFTAADPPENLEEMIVAEIGPSASPRATSFAFQLAVEVLASAGHAEPAMSALEHAATGILADVDWIAHCPALDILRPLPAFADLRAQVEARAASIWAA